MKIEDGKPHVTVAQVGARMHYAVPEMLNRNGMLAELYTDIIVPEKLSPILSSGVFGRPGKRFLGRKVSSSLRAKTNQSPGAALLAGLFLAAAKTEHSRNHVFSFQARALYRSVLKGGFGQANSVYGFTTASLEIFHEASRSGKHCFLEQYIAAQPFRDELIDRERSIYPGWEAAPSGHKYRSYSRVRNEWELADTIVCPSKFVADSLSQEGVDESKLRIVPYGVASPVSTRKSIIQSEPATKLKILYVGSVELRKGVHYLAEALGQLNPESYDAKVVGPIRIEPDGVHKLSKVACVLGQVPRNQVTSFFDWADVFVLPSLVEGSATVTYEALGRGIPVVCTANTGSIVDDGKNGIVVPARDSDALAGTLSLLADDRSLIAKLQKCAWNRRQEASLECYEQNLLKVLQERFETHD